jgi:hypothetical protein
VDETLASEPGRGFRAPAAAATINDDRTLPVSELGTTERELPERDVDGSSDVVARELVLRSHIEQERPSLGQRARGATARSAGLSNLCGR